MSLLSSCLLVDFADGRTEKGERGALYQPSAISVRFRRMTSSPASLLPVSPPAHHLEEELSSSKTALQFERIGTRCLQWASWILQNRIPPVIFVFPFRMPYFLRALTKFCVCPRCPCPRFYPSLFPPVPTPYFSFVDNGL